MAIYLLIGFVYGVWSLKRHEELYPYKLELWRLMLVFFINAFLWPISIPIAIYKKTLF
jgi:hypothetical protein